MRKIIFAALFVTLLQLFLCFSPVSANEPVEIISNYRIKQDSDQQWRCYANFTIINTSEQNLTLAWFAVNLDNVTWTNGTEVILNVGPHNISIGQELQPGEGITDLTIVFTTVGFSAEPSVLSLSIQISSPEFGVISGIMIIPELESFTMLLILISATSLALVYRRYKRAQPMYTRLV